MAASRSRSKVVRTHVQTRVHGADSACDSAALVVGTERFPLTGAQYQSPANDRDYPGEMVFDEDEDRSGSIGRINDSADCAGTPTRERLPRRAPKDGALGIEPEPFPSRPLLLIAEDGRIRWSSDSDDKSSAGRYCWDIFGCTARSLQKCKAIRRFKSDSGHRGAQLSVRARPPKEACLISSVELPFSGQLIWGPQSERSLALSIDLQRIASLAGFILTKDVINGGEAALHLIRIATRADSGKFFLSDLHGTRLLLAGCVGSDRSTPSQQQRLESERTVAHLAFSEGRPVTSLAAAACHLRADMTSACRHSAIGVPIPGPDERILGCLELAWHDSNVELEAIAQALWSAAVPLGYAIGAAYWTMSQQIARAGRGRTEQADASLLELLRENIGASATSVVMWDPRNHKVQSVDTFGESPPICPWMLSPETAPCSSRESASWFRLVALTKTADSWPEACRKVRYDGGSMCCVPVSGRGGDVGRAIVAFRHDSPRTPARLLVPLQVMLQQICLQRGQSIVPAIDTEHAPTVPKLGIRCFGHFEVAIDGQTLASSKFYRRDALTLLKILVLRAGKAVHRAKINEWLWPDTDERACINRLHGVIHALRSVIEPYPAERRWRYILTDGDTYTFCADNSAFIDLIEFQRRIAMAKSATRSGYFTSAVTLHLERAVELYRGDLYENDQYSEWCDVERTALLGEFIEALTNLARSYLTLGDANNAIRVLRRALVHDPAREDLHQELIRCLVRAKRHSEAKKQACECIRYLRDELNLAPSAETEFLYHSLSTS